MSVRRIATICMAALMCGVLLAGCSGGSPSSASSSAASSASSASSSSSESAASESASSASSSSASSASSSAASSSSSREKTPSEDFNRALIGEWHIYSSETSKNATTKTGPELTAQMREEGMHDTLTFSADGDVLVNKGRGKVVPYPWFSTDDDNVFEIEGMLDDPSIDGDEGEDITVTATLASSRLTLEYDTEKDGHVKLVYSKS